ncbi:MAG: hypothetical protein O3B41_04215 [Bacteroidetes bacterium]|nr:hypothetical protein [Bacteroidota bacterium]
MAPTNSDRLQGELPGQQAMFEPPAEDPNGSAARSRGSLHLKGTRSLESLRIRIDLASRELYRLREENHLLQRELDAVRHRGQAPSEGTSFIFSESPAVLQAKLESYIRVVDRYIELELAAENDNSDLEE